MSGGAKHGSVWEKRDEAFGWRAGALRTAVGHEVGLAGCGGL